MAKDGFKVMDSDMHIIEPPDLWQRYIEPRFKDVAPVGLAEMVQDLRLTHPGGRPWGRPQVAIEDLAARNASQENVKAEAKYRRFADRKWSAEAQLDAMDEEGIDVAVLYPSRGLFALSIPDLDPELAAAVARAYNDWLHDFCSADPSRLLGAGMISPFGIEDAVSESQRCAGELGFRAMFLRPNLVGGRTWHDPYYEPLWATLEQLEAPIGFHEGSGSELPQVGEQFGSNTMLRHIFCHPVEQMMTAASFCGGGILERHPGLKAAFLEGNCSWLPFLMWRMDEHWDWLGEVHAPDLTMAPSEYWKRQCFASAEPDEEPLKYVIDSLGNGGLVLSTDFPHLDSKFPRAIEKFLQMGIADEDKQRILWDNCAAFYGVQ